MCTVTIVPTPAPHAGQSAGWRMACSRDESHGRAPALPPTQTVIDEVGTLMPIDPASSGTWVAVNSVGLAITLLNYNLPVPQAERDLSRGLVVPCLIGSASLDEALLRCDTIDRQRMMPFRLVFCDGERVGLWRSTEPPDAMQIASFEGRPFFFTSSGLGDHLVEQPRRDVFASWFTGPVKDWPQRQDALHRHRWPDRPHLSICMDRDDARTVSYTTLTVGAEQIEMSYHPDRPDRPAQDVKRSLNRLVPR
ncbi:MAG: NRDE family protein [Planctomycetota bacterium]